MAKAPKAGRSKTRLCPALTPEQAAAMSAAFLRDITTNISRAAAFVPVDGMIAYAPAGGEALFDGHLAEGTGLLLADGVTEAAAGVSGFGLCLLHAMRSMLGAGYGAAIVLNSDSPTLPTLFLVRAVAVLLAGGDRVVLGPAEDGGYYLLGATQAHSHLFADIAWSTGSVAAATRARAAELGLEVVELPVWYDVDDKVALTRLAREVAGWRAPGAPPYPAPASAAALARIERGAAQVEAAE